VACKKQVGRYWHGYMSGARCKLFAYGLADAIATLALLASLKSRIALLLVPTYWHQKEAVKWM